MNQKLIGLYLRFREWLALERIADHYRRQSHPYPIVGAVEEVQLRGLIEGFRDWISAEVIRNPDALLDDHKERWFANHLRPFTQMNGYQKGAAIKKAIAAMSIREMLHADAYRAWDKSRRSPKPSTRWTPHEHRVLRS